MLSYILLLKLTQNQKSVVKRKEREEIIISGRGCDDGRWQMAVVLKRDGNPYNIFNYIYN
jgi:hypothetical protein